MSNIANSCNLGGNWTFKLIITFSVYYELGTNLLNNAFDHVGLGLEHNNVYHFLFVVVSSRGWVFIVALNLFWINLNSYLVLALRMMIRCFAVSISLSLYIYDSHFSISLIWRNFYYLWPFNNFGRGNLIV